MTTEKLDQFQLRIMNENSEVYSYHGSMHACVRMVRIIGKVSLLYVPLDTSEPLTLLWQSMTQKVKVAAVHNSLSIPMQYMWDSGYYITVPDNQEVESSI